MTGLRWGARTDVGRARTVNQDNVYAAAPLFAVADGMGGHAGGEVASRIALDTLAGAVTPAPVAADDGHVSIEAFVAGVRDANRAVFERSNADAELRGMGTTLCALALVTIGGEERLVVVNIGDSRAYVVQDGRLLQVTRDHSYVEDLVQAGEITRDQARDHPRRNIVTRALGIEPDVEIDSWEVTPYPGDRYLLCSDGLFNEVDDEALRAVLTGQTDAQVAADELVTLANEGGGHDNISVVVIDVTADDRSGPARQGDHTDVLPRPDVEAAEPPTAEAAPPDATPSDRAPRRRVIKTVALPLAVLLVGAVALAAITYFGRSGYFVAFADDNVAIYQGRPGGLLWVDPSVETTFALPRSSVPPDQLRRIEEGNTFDDRSDAEGYVTNVLDEAERLTAATSTTTTTTLPPTTTTLAPTTTVAPALPPEVTVAPDVPAVPDTAPPPGP